MNYLLQHGRWWAVLVIGLCIAVLAGSFIAIDYSFKGRSKGTHTPHAFTAPPAYNLAPPDIETSAAGSYLFGIPRGTWLVLSPYNYEANLLDYSQPVADIDYGLPTGTQAKVRLPGFATDRYVYKGAVYVTGSGWVQKWAAPNGGRFAFLHISTLYTPSYGMPVINAPKNIVLPGTKPGISNDGDNLTARVVGYTSTTNINYSLATWPGGSYVGVSGWPDWSQYGNGGYGPGDAHLCLLLDARAAEWFADIVDGRHKPLKPPKPPPHFILKHWQAWCSKHHIKHCTKARYTVGKHRYYYADAITWTPRQWLKGVVRRTTYPGSKTRKTFRRTDFQCGVIFTWPRTHYKPKVVKHKCHG